MPGQNNLNVSIVHTMGFEHDFTVLFEGAVVVVSVSFEEADIDVAHLRFALAYRNRVVITGEGKMRHQQDSLPLPDRCDEYIQLLVRDSVLRSRQVSETMASSRSVK